MGGGDATRPAAQLQQAKVTVAIGAACAEGTVLLTDSPGPLYDPERHAWCGEPDPNDPKLVVLPKTGVAFIHSGSRPDFLSLQ